MYIYHYPIQCVFTPPRRMFSREGGGGGGGPGLHWETFWMDGIPFSLLDYDSRRSAIGFLSLMLACTTVVVFGCVCVFVCFASHHTLIQFPRACTHNTHYTHTQRENETTDQLLEEIQWRLISPVHVVKKEDDGHSWPEAVDHFEQTNQHPDSTTHQQKYNEHKNFTVSDV